MTEWQETKFSEQPDTLFKIGPGIYMQTRNVEFISDEEGYSCETRELTESEMKLLNQIADQASLITDIEFALTELAEIIGGE